MALARARIRERSARWIRGWSQSRYLGAPLPKEPEFWALIDQLKKDLGPEAASVIGDLVDDATGVWTRQLYIALLAGLKDPAAESRLAALASKEEEDIGSRGLALYGLGLLKTDSAWTAAVAAWRDTDPLARDHFYPGLALFGERAAPFFFEQAERIDFDPYRAHALSQIQGSKERLWELAETSTNDSIRVGALQALFREPDPEIVSKLLGHLEDPQLPSERRVTEAMVLGLSVRLGTLSLGENPQLLDRVLAHWDQWPDNLKWSLLCDPAVRSAKPGELDRIPAPKTRNDAYIQALLGDPERQGRLATYGASQPGQDTMMYLMAHLAEAKSVTDPALVDLARKETLRLTGDVGRQYWAWTALLPAPAEVRAQALADVARTALELPQESDRMRLLAGLSVAGPDAVPVAVELLRKETNPTVRFELLNTALSMPGHEDELRTLARTEIDQILGGVTDSGLRYAAAHPEGDREGVARYGVLLRQVFSTYGTPADIPAIRDYASRMVMPDALGGNKPPPPDPADWRGTDYYRGDLQEALLNSIDAIRARYPDAPGK